MNPMASILKTIDVDVPLSTVYKQWTKFEAFSQFMACLKQVHQLDGNLLHWRAEVMGEEVDWFTEITQQIPDERITWRSTSGAKHTGSVSFQPLGPARTRLTLRLECEPSAQAEFGGNGLDLVAISVEGDLRRFKKFIEGPSVSKSVRHLRFAPRDVA